MATTTQVVRQEPQLSAASLPVATDGITPFPDRRWQIRVEAVPTRPEYNLGRWQALLDAGAVRGRLVLRQRQPGDRIRPAGGIGSRRGGSKVGGVVGRGCPNNWVRISRPRISASSDGTAFPIWRWAEARFPTTWT